MFIFDEDFWGYAFIVLLVLSIIGISFAMYRYEVNSNLCKEKGGYIVELSDGYSCVKLEKIKLKGNNDT